MPRKVIHFALRRRVVPEDLVDGVMSLYKGCKTAVSVEGELSSSFSLKVDGSLMEFLYAHNLVLCVESLNEVMDKYGR